MHLIYETTQQAVLPRRFMFFGSITFNANDSNDSIARSTLKTCFKLSEQPVPECSTQNSEVYAKKTLSSKSTPGTLKPQDRNPKPETPNRKTLKPQTISLGPFPSEYMAFWRFRFGKVLRRRRKPEELSMGLVRVSDGCRVQVFRAPA